MSDDRIVGLSPAWSEQPVDDADVWCRSGGQWLTAANVAVPTRLVRTIAGVVSFMDQRGAALADDVGASGVGVLGERAATAKLPAAGRVSCGGASRLLECADGWLAITLARPEDVASIPAWLGTAVEGDAWTTVEHGVRRASGAELVAQAELLGLACTLVGEVSSADAVLVERCGASVSRAVEQLVVVNLASLWAGPLAADTLARAGARVINVESMARPDGGRLMRLFFRALHGRSESVALPLQTERGCRQLSDLLECADVVIEGSRPRALVQMGIQAREVVGRGPSVWLSITGHGRQSNRIGFGDDAAAAGGLVGWSGGEPTFLADAVADPLTGLIAAASIAQLAEQGGRWLVDVSLARVASTCAPRPDDLASPPRRHGKRPAPRRDPGGALPLGRDTESVLREFGIAS